ncbi:CaiB/BaiF CoA-transferase family protein [Bordetella sp. BOR01]|uniref:CaiB/BaiF CoA transferase family protein n=1 Tax=Bordetella sp. BOR01 TaxID=2854779 RepID=UPI001C464AFF|nr:CoA transferase [Bordetella sp. BOR01]MBV7484784.1 CoA transferase [Bordetella sp. BOR01]
MEDAVDKRPLKGIRILDLSRVFSGPWGTQILGDLGAEVIKVEQPGRGDDMRRLGPPFLPDLQGAPTEESSYYLSTNRNKKSIAVDISTPQGQEVIRGLAAVSDVFIENFKVGNLAKYGLDYAPISEINPRIVYCSITAFGQTGPNRHRLGYDTLLQAMCGVMSVTGHPDQHPGGGPVKVGMVLSDMLAGMYAAMAIQSALYARDTGGQGDKKGQYIDISMFDAQLAAMSHQAMHYLVSGENPARFGNGAPSVSPSNAFRCSDGYIVMVAGNDAQFKKLCGVIGADALAEDPRYRSNGNRVVHREALIQDLERIFCTRTKAQWLATLEQANLVAGPINEMSDTFADPQIAARGIVTQATHACGTQVPLIVSPMRMSDTPLDVYMAPPTSGQHTREVLSSLLGMGDQEIAEVSRLPRG